MTFTRSGCTAAALLTGLALSVNPALAQAQISVLLAGEAYEGPPAFELRMGDLVIGSGQLTGAIDTETQGRLFSNPAPLDFLEEFAFTVSDAAFEPDMDVTIFLVNDKFLAEGMGRDRNLFVSAISVNGLVLRGGDLKHMTEGAESQVDYQAGLLPVYAGEDHVVAAPPEGGWPLAGVAEVTSLLPLMPVARPEAL